MQPGFYENPERTGYPYRDTVYGMYVYAKFTWLKEAKQKNWASLSPIFAFDVKPFYFR